MRRPVLLRRRCSNAPDLSAETSVRREMARRPQFSKKQVVAYVPRNKHRHEPRAHAQDTRGAGRPRRKRATAGGRWSIPLPLVTAHRGGVDPKRPTFRPYTERRSGASGAARSKRRRFPARSRYRGRALSWRIDPRGSFPEGEARAGLSAPFGTMADCTPHGRPLPACCPAASRSLGGCHPASTVTETGVLQPHTELALDPGGGLRHGLHARAL